MDSRPLVASAIQYGNGASFWVEYPSGLVDLSRSHPLHDGQDSPPELAAGQIDLAVHGERTVRIDTSASALVVVDMQNYFLHPKLRDHPSGLKCIDHLLELVPVLRSKNIKIIWLNWGLTEHELKTIPPSLARGFRRGGRNGLGSELPEGFGRLLMRDEPNSQLYGPLQELYEQGRVKGTDFWIHKNRLSGLWGYQTGLDLFLKEQGITTLFFAGVNADQCVLGTLVDASYRGYDCIVIEDGIATTSPAGGLENVLINSQNVNNNFPLDIDMTLNAHLTGLWVRHKNITYIAWL